MGHDLYRVIEPHSGREVVALISPFSIVSRRSSASRLRCAAPIGAVLRGKIVAHYTPNFSDRSTDE